MAVQTEARVRSRTTSPPEIVHKNLSMEAKRLLDFKSRHVRRRNQTPCPECATLVSVHANKCPQCSSDISAHTSKIREELDNLKGITEQLRELHDRYMDCREDEISMRPVWERAKDLLTEPRLRDDLKVILPTFLLFFTLIIALRILGNGPLFWTFSVAGGFVAYSLLRRSNHRQYMIVDLYRSVLVIGLVIVMSGAPMSPLSGFPIVSPSAVEVESPMVNVRQSPTTQSPVVTTVEKGVSLQVIDRRGDWYRVRTTGGETGWVHSSVVKK